MENTEIGWTHRARPDGSLMPGHTFNAWQGCHKVSPACKHCYAEAGARRWGLKIWGQDAGRKFMSEDYWKKPRKWNEMARASGERHLVFANSWSDVLEDRDDLRDARDRLVRTIEDTPWLMWLLLTKRPENAERLLPVRWTEGHVDNVALGTTAENQEWLNRRAPHLVRASRWAAFTFLSVEPMLERVDLSYWCETIDHCTGCGGEFSPQENDRCPAPECPSPTSGLIRTWGHEQAEAYRLGERHEQEGDIVGGPPIAWIIGGGESGAGRTELDLDAAAHLARYCSANDLAFYMKQDSGPKPGQQGRLPDWLWALKEHPPIGEPSDRTMLRA